MERKFLEGAGGTRYYLMHERDGVSLGVAPMFDVSGEDALLIGFRFRAQPSGEEDLDSYHEFVEAFPNLPFKKLDASRASGEAGTYCRCSRKEAWRGVLVFEKQRMMDNLIAALEDGIEYTLPEDLKTDFEAYFMEAIWEAALDEMPGTYVFGPPMLDRQMAYQDLAEHSNQPQGGAKGERSTKPAQSLDAQYKDESDEKENQGGSSTPLNPKDLDQ